MLRFIQTFLNSAKVFWARRIRFGRDAQPYIFETRMDYQTILNTISTEFDAKFYLATYVDVQKSRCDPLQHYAKYGWRERRDPTPFFSTSYYLDRNPEVMRLNLNPFYHYIVRGRREGRMPNPIGRYQWPKPRAPRDQEWFRAFPASDYTHASITVIMPVYRGRDETLAAIFSVLTNPQSTPFELLVINDCGPDESLNQSLRGLSRRGLISYMETPHNLGFAGAINVGLASRPNLDVVLLNSDTLVFGDWIDRLVEHAASDVLVATITPLSNNATICSYPEINRNNRIALEVEPSELDGFARSCNRGRHTIVPTGVGFCFYMRRDVINQIGELDAITFPKGYGEENDFCMRALKAGFKNVIAHDIFVYHAGRVSFLESADAASTAGEIGLLKKHPDYKSRIMAYCKADPAKELRIRLDLYRLAKILGADSAIFITHRLSGGVETHVTHMSERLHAEGIKVLYLRLEKGTEGTITFEPSPQFDIFLPSLDQLSIFKYADLLAEFLRWVSPKIVHVHSFAGFNPRAVSTIINVVKSSELCYDYTVHDFDPICVKDQKMITAEGEFCGQPEVMVCRSCIRADHRVSYEIDPGIRRDEFAGILSNARCVFVPSSDTSVRLSRAFPNVALLVRRHEERPFNIRWPDPPDFSAGITRIAIIGAIGRHKGSGILHALATDARARKLPVQYSIIGYSDLRDELAKLGVTETGRYADDFVASEHLTAFRPHLVFLPSIVPETHCYVLSLALAAGVPPVVFDIGAPAERLRDIKTGHVLSISLASQPSALNDALLDLPLRELWRNRRAAKRVVYSSLLGDYYGFDADDKRANMKARGTN
jgi:GT2 family glycosyltransferase/glycosyltransferase involved in cell wall biosynthesis